MRFQFVEFNLSNLLSIEPKPEFNRAGNAVTLFKNLLFHKVIESWLQSLVQALILDSESLPLDVFCSDDGSGLIFSVISDELGKSAFHSVSFLHKLSLVILTKKLCGLWSKKFGKGTVELGMSDCWRSPCLKLVIPIPKSHGNRNDSHIK